MVFTASSLPNTTIAVGDDTCYYEVVARSWRPHLTEIFKLNVGIRDVILVCEIERESDVNVRVRFGGELGEWIRK
jgi:hypothetical protein